MVEDAFKRPLARTIELLIKLYGEKHGFNFNPTLLALLQLHHRVSVPATEKKSRTSNSNGDAASAAASFAAFRHGDPTERTFVGGLRCLQLILSTMNPIASEPSFKKAAMHWLNAPKDTSPPVTLDATAADLALVLQEREQEYAVRLADDALDFDDGVEERAVLAIAALFVTKSDSLLGFAQLVPRVFDVYLARGECRRHPLHEESRDKPSCITWERLPSPPQGGTRCRLLAGQAAHFHAG